MNKPFPWFPLGVLHSQVTDAGLIFFARHPTLESFSLAKMGNMSQAGLASVASMPQVQEVAIRFLSMPT